MNAFIKAQSASLFASVFDLMTTVLGVQFLGLWYITASVTGTIAGGWLNFVLGRNWVFKSSQKRIRLQLAKYLLVWTGNLLLVAGGVFILTRLTGFNYLYSKIFVSLTVGLLYNYIMQKRFVFPQAERIRKREELWAELSRVKHNDIYK